MIWGSPIRLGNLQLLSTGDFAGIESAFFSDASNDGDLSLKKLGYHWDLISRVKPSRNGVTIWLFNIAMENHLF